VLAVLLVVLWEVLVVGLEEAGEVLRAVGLGLTQVEVLEAGVVTLLRVQVELQAPLWLVREEAGAVLRAVGLEGVEVLQAVEAEA
jgi:hypothetical protein